MLHSSRETKPAGGARHEIWLCWLVVLGLVIAATAGSCLAGDRPEPLPATSIFHYSVRVSVEPADRSLRAVDSIYVTADAVVGGKLNFLINKTLSVESVSSSCPITKWYTQDNAEPSLFKPKPDSEDIETVKHGRGLFIQFDEAKPCPARFPIVVAFSGVIYDSLHAPAQNYAKGFESTTGLITSEGVFLSSESLWYPFQFGRMFSFRLKSDVPPDWKAVSQGALVREAAEKVQDAKGLSADRMIDVWQEANPAPELYLVAGRYVTHQDESGGVKIMTYTYEPSDSLCQVYIDATKRYLAMYDKLIGPYPFAKFALVENFWQTGFGMPSFTLLGSKVIRLPFIVTTSYGHEILHNWWGNSVFVDYDEGNWCEGLTTYGADYLYKAKMSPATARDYRHLTLVTFNDYVTERKDFPLSEFLERSDAATQSVGYGKSLMVYHMLRNSLGDSLFWQGLRDFYAKYKFKLATWSDLAGVFSETSGRDLTWFFDQWVKRPGAPSVALTNVERVKRNGSDAVKFTLKQVSPLFTVDWPVRIDTASGAGKFDENFTVRLSSQDSTYTIETKGLPLAVAIDPDFDVFRRLYLEEIPLTLGGMLARDSTLVVVGAGEDEATKTALREVARAWDLAGSILDESPQLESRASSNYVWFMGRGQLASKLLAPLKDQLEITDEKVRIGDSTYALKGNTLVLAIRNPRDEHLGIGVVLTQDVASLRAIAPRLPYYNSYSYLLFEKDKVIARGVWKERKSPLRVDLADR